MKEIIKNKAGKYGLPLGVVKAIIIVESTNNTWATRYEPKYRWLYNVDDYVNGFQNRTTEEICQKISWGPMQVMGAVARELGFKGTFLSELNDPEVGIEYGCMHLSNLKRRFTMSDCLSVFCDRMVAAYNAGSPRLKKNGEYVNQDYVDKVLQNWK